ncbi:MAG: Rrf2 family transcriptional regulator [Armatimonadetes bacterium]|nr:Rrf2 family transcriptional regulator [Armatimonadota bacterium]
MRLSRKSEYALLALIHLAKNFDIKLVTLKALSGQNDIPPKFLETILIFLKQAGYIRSVRGPKGGYKLAKSPDQIALAEIFRCIDGPLAPVISASLHFYEKSPIEKSKKLHTLLKEIRDYVSAILEKTTLKDLL